MISAFLVGAFLVFSSTIVARRLLCADPPREGMASRGAWRSRTRKASPPGAEGGLSDGGHAVAGPGRWCSASTASPPTSPRSRSWREIPFLPAAWLLPDFQRLLPAADALRTGQAPQGCRRRQLWRGRRAHHRPAPPPRLPPIG